MLSLLGVAVVLTAFVMVFLLVTGNRASRASDGRVTPDVILQDMEKKELSIDGRLVFPTKAELTFGIGGTVGEVLVIEGGGR